MITLSSLKGTIQLSLQDLISQLSKEDMLEIMACGSQPEKTRQDKDGNPIYIYEQPKKGIDLGEGRTCNFCEKQVCSCSERLLDGSWQFKEDKIEEIDISRLQLKNSYIIRFNYLASKLNEIIRFLNKLKDK